MSPSDKPPETIDSYVMTYDLWGIVDFLFRFPRSYCEHPYYNINEKKNPHVKLISVIVKICSMLFYYFCLPLF